MELYEYFLQVQPRCDEKKWNQAVDKSNLGKGETPSPLLLIADRGP